MVVCFFVVKKTEEIMNIKAKFHLDGEEVEGRIFYIKSNESWDTFYIVDRKGKVHKQAVTNVTITDQEYLMK
jgi:hypothetical protein